MDSEQRCYICRKAWTEGTGEVRQGTIRLVLDHRTLVRDIYAHVDCAKEWGA